MKREIQPGSIPLVKYFFDYTNYNTLLETNKQLNTTLNCEEENKENGETILKIKITKDIADNIYRLMQTQSNMSIEDDTLFVQIDPKQIKDNQTTFYINGTFDEKGNPRQRAYGISITRPQKENSFLIDRSDTL